MNESLFRMCTGGHIAVTRTRDIESDSLVYSDVKFGDAEGHDCFYFPLRTKMSVSASVPGSNTDSNTPFLLRAKDKRNPYQVQLISESAPGLHLFCIPCIIQFTLVLRQF
jgi:hypothetical protein